MPASILWRTQPEEGRQTTSGYGTASFEFDGGELVDQWELFCRSHLPITAVIYSGGKSLHAWVRVDAQTQEEYQQRTAAAFEWFKANSKRADLDEKTTDAPRLSRLAGALREGAAVIFWHWR